VGDIKAVVRLVAEIAWLFSRWLFSREEIFEDKLPIPLCEWGVTGSAGYLPIICLRPSLNFDHK
jgi:hypothetical protein